MPEKEGGPRRERQNAQARGETERSLRREEPSRAPPAEPPAPIPPEFAAALQVTDAERVWIREHLGRFQEDRLIIDVIARIKAGKEATVYACSAHPSTGRSLIAAKLYRQRSLRSSRNVAQYQEGRDVLDEDGNVRQPRSGRMDKAIAQKSARGTAAVQTSWLMHEFTSLKALHARGADVPEPLAHGDQALLMEFIGDGADAAPTLIDVAIGSDDAERLFERVMFNVELLLAMGWVHGDLSAYNILYQHGRIVLIDFPQTVDARYNPRARAIFGRDIERVAGYFEHFGWSVEPRQLARELWAKHISDLE